MERILELQKLATSDSKDEDGVVGGPGSCSSCGMISCLERFIEGLNKEENGWNVFSNSRSLSRLSLKMKMLHTFKVPVLVRF